MRVTIALAGAVTAAMIAVAVHAPSARSACSATQLIVYRGLNYFGAPALRHVRTGGRVHAAVPGCNDTVPRENERPRQVVVRRVAGISPRVALLGRSQVVYVASGLFPQVSSFPLHRVLYARDEPQECRGINPAIAYVITGRVEQTPLAFFPFFRVRANRRSRVVFVDASTRLSYPATRRLVGGAQVRITAGVCGRKVVARRIELR